METLEGWSQDIDNLAVVADNVKVITVGFDCVSLVDPCNLDVSS